MHGKLTQPKIDRYISCLRRNDHFGMTSCIYDDKSQKLLDELFEQQKIFTLVNGDAITYSSDDKMHTIFVFMQ